MAPAHASVTAEMDTLCVDPSKLQVGKPSKVDHSLYGKVRYDGGTKLALSIKNAYVVRHQTMDADLLKYGILDVSVASPARRKMADVDDALIALVIKNIPLWFAKGAVEPSTIDEFYKRSIVTTSAGPVLRFKVQRDACLLATGPYDLVLRCKGLRFFKHVFILEWELMAASPLEARVGSDATMFVEDDEGCDLRSAGVSSEDIGPTWEETKALEMWRDAEDMKERLEQKKHALDEAMREILEIQTDLDDASWPIVPDPVRHLTHVGDRLARARTLVMVQRYNALQQQRDSERFRDYVAYNNGNVHALPVPVAAGAMERVAPMPEPLPCLPPKTVATPARRQIARESRAVAEMQQADAHPDPATTFYDEFDKTFGDGDAKGGACFPKDKLTAEDLLPKDAINSKWAQANPIGHGSLRDGNFLQAGYHVGLNTSQGSKRNGNLQFRSEPPNSKHVVSPWLNSDYEPDLLRRPLEVGENC